jgi:hypothetical protein
MSLGKNPDKGRVTVLSVTVPLTVVTLGDEVTLVLLPQQSYKHYLEVTY